MNIECLCRNKKADVQQEEINENLDSIFQDIIKIAEQLNDYLIDLTADVSGVLPLANLAGGGSGQILTGNGVNVAPSFATAPAAGVPKIGGSASAGKRVAWAQYAGAAGSAMSSVGTPAVTVTGGTNVKDSSGFWATPQSIAGGSCRFSFANVFTRVDLLPTLIVRLRTPATITNVRFLAGLNESLAGVNTDTPNTGTQRGIYVRYSTAIPDGGWVVQTVDGSGRTTSATVLAIAASTIYTITITVNSTSSVTVDINGTAITVTANIITGVDLGAEILAADLSGGAATQFDVESVYLESN